MKKEKIPYMRIGTSYYRIIEKPLVSGDTITKIVSWNAGTIIADEGKEYLAQVPKLLGFCCIPNHIEYNQIVDDFYNTYHELSFSPYQKSVAEIQIPYSLQFIKHIFNEQLEIGLDYLKLLYEKPTQILPILCLVSKERATGKSTFIKWLKAIFSLNMTYIKGDSFASQFNADWASKLIVAVDEVFFDRKEITERLKYLSTTDKDKVEAKGKDREEIDFFAKFILCSNNEDSFIQIDSQEIRFWVRKVKPFEKEDTEFLQKLNQEIPYFIKFLLDRPFSNSKKTRMWFTPEQIKTNALRRLVWLNNNKLEKEMITFFYEIFDSNNYNEIKASPKDIASNLYKITKNKYQANEIRKILKNHWQLEPQSNSLSYKGYEFTSFGEYAEIDRVGRYYTVKKSLIHHYFDELMKD